MIALISGATKDVKKQLLSPYIGQLISPRSRNRIILNEWAADNDCFNGWGTDEERRYRRMLKGIPKGARFVTCPDKVGDHGTTLSRWDYWSREVESNGHVPAFVLQDGCGLGDVPECHAVFIGGSTEYKLSEGVVRIVEWAKRLGMWVHMGRVNSQRRINYAASIGCDSIDGTKCSMFPGFIPTYLSWVEAATNQRYLFQ